MRSDRATLVGGGPAGLFAAYLLLNRGYGVDLYEGKTRPGRKFLLAGQTGLNITRREPPSQMARRYGNRESFFLSLLRDFPPGDLIAWMGELGISSREGNGAKIYSDNITPGEFLSLWMSRLEANPLFRFRGGMRFTRWDGGGPVLSGPEGEMTLTDRPVLFALGGASWPETGSDGTWASLFRERGIGLAPFKPMNCAFKVNWSSRFLESRVNSPLKNIALMFRGETRRGELMATEMGLEGMPLYWFSLPLRQEIERIGTALIHMDLTPDLDEENLRNLLVKRPVKKSLSSFLKGTLRFSPQKASLVHEAVSEAGKLSPPDLARIIKALPLTLTGTERLERAISSSGGILFSELDDTLMIRREPGCFVAGEMMDWEAPTGGYLLQGCFSTAFRAVSGMEAFLKCGK